MEYVILDETGFERYMPIDEAIKIAERLLREKNLSTLISPPRSYMRAEKGNIILTSGGSYDYGVIGSRIHGRYITQDQIHMQVAVVFDIDTGELQGLVLSETIGALAVGALGAVAIKNLSRLDSKVVGIIGSGIKAWKQLEGAVTVRTIDRAMVYDFDGNSSRVFAEGYSGSLGIKIDAVSTPKEVVENADILILATDSSSPVFEPSWLKPGTHINTVGPNYKESHELDERVSQMSRLIATDSMDEIKAYSKPFFLMGVADRERIIELSELITTGYSRESEGDLTLFCSVGLPGLEVVLAGQAIKNSGMGKQSPQRVD